METQKEAKKSKVKQEQVKKHINDFPEFKDKVLKKMKLFQLDIKKFFIENNVDMSVDVAIDLDDGTESADDRLMNEAENMIKRFRQGINKLAAEEKIKVRTNIVLIKKEP